MCCPTQPAILKLQLENGQPVQVQARIEHEEGYELTAIPVVALLMEYDQVRKPGLHMMGHLAEPGRLFDDMQKMGVHLTMEDRPKTMVNRPSSIV